MNWILSAIWGPMAAGRAVNIDKEKEDDHTTHLGKSDTVQADTKWAKMVTWW